MKKSLFIFLLFCCLTGHTQPLTLERCQQLARENFPAISQKELINELSEYNISNAKRNWLPRVTLNLQANYQSDVTTIPEALNTMLGSTFEGLHKDQYKATVQIEQMIFEGGVVKSQVKKEKAEQDVSIAGWEVEMYRLKEQVNQLYFGILLLQEKIKALDIMISELNRNEKLIGAYISNGVAGQNDLDQVRVEILSAGQQRSELTASVKAYKAMLGLMIDRTISPEEELQRPEDAVIPLNGEINRPELTYYNARERSLQAQREGINATVKPQLAVFLQGAYANPGLDLFADLQENQWSPYFIAGIRLQWNFSAFYSRKNNLSKINTGISRIGTEKEIFLYQTRIRQAEEKAAIERMRDVMQQDDQIIALRNAIRLRTEAGIKNGTMTVSDLLREMHAENLARQNKAAHEIEWLKNLYDLKNITNQ